MVINSMADYDNRILVLKTIRLSLRGRLTSGLTGTRGKDAICLVNMVVIGQKKIDGHSTMKYVDFEINRCYLLNHAQSIEPHCVFFALF